MGLTKFCLEPFHRNQRSEEAGQRIDATLRIVLFGAQKSALGRFPPAIIMQPLTATPFIQTSPFFHPDRRVERWVLPPTGPVDHISASDSAAGFTAPGLTVGRRLGVGSWVMQQRGLICSCVCTFVRNLRGSTCTTID